MAADFEFFKLAEPDAAANVETDGPEEENDEVVAAAEEEEEADAEEEDDEEQIPKNDLPAQASEDVDDDSEDNKPLEPSASTTPMVTITFDRELMLATRNASRGQLDSSRPIVDNGQAGHAVVEAEFHDGSLNRVPGLTWEAFRALARDGKSRGMGSLLSLQHVKTKHAITIAQRVDRKLLLSIYEQGRQKLQINQELFGPVPDQSTQSPISDATLAAALKFMTPIAERFAKNELDANELIPERDRLLALSNLIAPKKGALKRPAAAPPANAEEPGEKAIQTKKRPKAQAKASGKVEQPSRGETSASANAQKSEPKVEQSEWQGYEEQEPMPFGIVELEFDA